MWRQPHPVRIICPENEAKGTGVRVCERMCMLSTHSCHLRRCEVLSYGPQRSTAHAVCRRQLLEAEPSWSYLAALSSDG